MSLAGEGAVCIWHDLLPEAKPEFYEWHNREHMPERVGIPGFNRGRRYIAVEGGPEYFNLYEADTAELLAGPGYLDRLNAPTEWTRRVVPSFRNVSRSVCRVAFSEGVGSGGAMLTLRFDVPPAQRAAAVAALTNDLLPLLPLRPGVTGVHLCLADEAVSTLETVEKKARADTTLVPTWIVLVEGIDTAAVKATGSALLSWLASLLPGAPSPALSVYQHQYTRDKATGNVT